MTYGSCQSRCESKVQKWLNPCSSASLASCTVRAAGGLVCSTAPKSMCVLCVFLRQAQERRRSLSLSKCRLDQVLRESALEVPAVALGAEVLVVVDDHLASREHGVDVPVDLESLVGGVVHVHVVRLADADRGVPVRVVDRKSVV